jgi:ubiquinone/menaquinone biosynthesis C-methylase UbiE
MKALSEKQNEIQKHYGLVANTSADACDASRGCGKPLSRARLRQGDYVLDLGCGAGLDVVQAALQVGPAGHVFGLDMTPQMLELAKRSADAAGLGNVSLLQGLIEAIPLPECSVDAIISNCVINLSDNRLAVLREAYRVLRDSGRFVVADIVLCESGLPEAQREAAAPLLGCVNGVLDTGEYERFMTQAGFRDVEVDVYRRYPAELLELRARKRGQRDLWEWLDPTCVDNAFGGAFIVGVRR